MTTADAWDVYCDWEKEYRAQSDGIEASYDELEFHEKSMLYNREIDLRNKALNEAIEAVKSLPLPLGRRYEKFEIYRDMMLRRIDAVREKR